MKVADINKDEIMNMLGSILGEDKKDSVGALLNSIDTQKSNSKSDDAQTLNTAEIMSKMARVMDKLQHTGNKHEFALLSAIRPYMRDSRKTKVDTCLKMLQVVSVVNEMKKEG